MRSAVFLAASSMGRLLRGSWLKRWHYSQLRPGRRWGACWLRKGVFGRVGSHPLPLPFREGVKRNLRGETPRAPSLRGAMPLSRLTCGGMGEEGECVSAVEDAFGVVHSHPLPFLFGKG